MSTVLNPTVSCSTLRSTALYRPSAVLRPPSFTERVTRRRSKDTIPVSPPVTTDDSASYSTLQRHLQSLYDFPLAYQLKVAETDYAQPQTEQDEETRAPNEYHLNFGKAIESIKDDFPELFVRDIDYSIFREDLIFKDPVNTFQGLRWYKYMLTSLRWHGRIFFKRVSVRIHSLWPREEGMIRVRWSVHAIPRIPWEAEGIFDGVSVYKLDSHGKVYEHSVDNIVFRDPPMFRLPVLFADLSAVPGSNTPIPIGFGCITFFQWRCPYRISARIRANCPLCRRKIPPRWKFSFF